jgi:hypothetical protein
VTERHLGVAAPMLGRIEGWEQDFFVNPHGWK